MGKKDFKLDEVNSPGRYENMGDKLSFLQRLLGGMRAFFNGYRFINKHSLWRYSIIPAILSLLLGVTLIILFYFLLSGLADSLFSRDNTAGSIILYWMAKIFSIVISIFVTIYAYRSLSMIVVNPFLGPLLSQIEKILTGKSVEVTITKDIKNALTGAFIGIKFFIFEIFILFLSLFTGPLSPVIVIWVEAYFLGRGTFDYLLEKHTKTLAERKVRAKSYYPELQGLGLAHFFILMIPIVGIFIAPASSLTGAALIFYAAEDE